MNYEIPAEARFSAKSSGGAIPYVRVSRVERELVARAAVSFDAADEKGRALGYEYAVDREVWAIDASSHSMIREDQVQAFLGESFVVRPHALRDGAQFGPIPVRSVGRFRSIDEAVAFGAEKIEAARKRMEV